MHRLGQQCRLSRRMCIAPFVAWLVLGLICGAAQAQRSGLRVPASEAEQYRLLLAAIEERPGTLLAGPDCPELYALSGRPRTPNRDPDPSPDRAAAATSRPGADPQPKEAGWPKKRLSKYRP